MINDMNVSMVLSSCDSYDDTWRPFFAQLKKHWPDFNMPVYLGTESKTFQYDQFDIRCPLSEGEKYCQWSKRILKLLDYVETDYVLFALDDFWLTDEVDQDAFYKVLNYMQQSKRMGFVCLKQEVIPGKSSEMDIASCIDSEYPELYRCLKNKSFRITTQFGLWRKSYLKKILREHESAWYFETRATWRSQFYWERIYSVKQSIFKYPVGGFIGGGKCYEDYIELFDRDLISQTITKRGIIKYGSPRKYPDVEKNFNYYYSKILSVLPKWR